MQDDQWFYRLLVTFAFMADQPVDDGDAAMRLVILLKQQDPFMLLKRDGPELWALLQRFGLVTPHKGQERMDALTPELACRVLVSFEKWRHSVKQLNHARDAFAAFDRHYGDKHERLKYQDHKITSTSQTASTGHRGCIGEGHAAEP